MISSWSPGAYSNGSNRSPLPLLGEECAACLIGVEKVRLQMRPVRTLSAFFGGDCRLLRMLGVVASFVSSLIGFGSFLAPRGGATAVRPDSTSSCRIFASNLIFRN